MTEIIKNSFLVTLSTLLFTVFVFKPCWSADKIFISQLSRSFQYVPAYVSVSKGFFKEEGIDPILVQMKAQVSTAALDSGQAHYALAGPSTLNATIQGAPFKLVSVLTEKTLHFIVGAKEIGSLSDLRGKKVGTARIGGADHLAALEILKAKGLDNIQFVTVGGDEPVRAEFLRQGIVDAVIVGPPFPLMLSRQGYKILGGPSDAAQGVLSGIGTKDERLREKPAEVRRFLRAVLRGIRFFHEQKEETVSVMMQWLNQDRPLAAQSYDVIKPYFTTDGMTTDSNVAFNIELLKTLIKSNKPISVSQVRDFTIIRELHRELGISATTR